MLRNAQALLVMWLAASCAAVEPPDPDTVPDSAADAAPDVVARRGASDDHRDDHHRGHHRQRPIDSLASAAARSHRLVGTAVDTPFLTGDPVYAATLAAEFSYVTPRNETKWGSLQPVDPDHW